MLIGSCAHCSYLRSEGEKNLELLEIYIIYSVFFLLIYLTLCRIMERKRKNVRRMADQSNQWESTICKPNFYSDASLLAACYLVSQIDKHDDNNLFIRILLDVWWVYIAG